MQARFNPTPLSLGSEHKPMARAPAMYAVGTNPISVTVLFAESATSAQYEETAFFAHEHFLAVTGKDETKRTMTLVGTPDNLEKAFNVCLAHVINPRTGHQIRTSTGAIQVPASVAPHVIAVLGLDNRPVAKPRMRFRAKGAHPNTAARPFTPPEVADLYSFPKGLDGTGVTVAIIELGGGYLESDLSQFFTGLGLKVPTIISRSVGGANNSPGSDADGEVVLDISVAGSIAPGAKYVMYFADNTDQGFVNAILDVATDTVNKPWILSISWGGAEDDWTPMVLGAMNAALKMATENGRSNFVAAGDNGSSDGDPTGAHVDHPASSEFTLACGGTELVESDGAIVSETVWNDGTDGGATGGGVSNVFGLPAYQKGHANVPLSPTGFLGRGVPDVAGNADPNRGYEIVLNGQMQVIGGTSAVAPLYAGLFARILQKLGKPIGLPNSHLYRITENVYRDVTSGNNGAYKAAVNWDPVSGLGSINGTALLNALLKVLAPEPASKPAAKPENQIQQPSKNPRQQ